MKILKKITVLGFFICMPALAAEIVVVDGDSLLIDNRRVRMLGIDAPEYSQTCQNADGTIYNCGQESKEALQKMIDVGNITCDCLPQPDRYKRKLCECFGNNTSINGEMVLLGHAVRYRTERFAAEENAAKSSKSGIWRGKFMRPALYRVLQRQTRK
jgi:endonuclease YncB( thermonuclease family)